MLGIASGELAAAWDQMLLLGRKVARERIAPFLVMPFRHAAYIGMGELPNPTRHRRLPGFVSEAVSRTGPSSKWSGSSRPEAPARLACSTPRPSSLWDRSRCGPADAGWHRCPVPRVTNDGSADRLQILRR